MHGNTGSFNKMVKRNRLSVNFQGNKPSLNTDLNHVTGAKDKNGQVP